jgi:hypothetical protein
LGEPLISMADTFPPSNHSWRSIHKRQIPPKVLQAVRATEKRGEISRVH